MFAKSIIDSDTFLDMPLTTQALYFHLSMRADDDGFVNNPRKIMRMIGADDDSLKLLTAKQFLIPFESGIVVIRHWRIHNYIQKDRYHETQYTAEKAMITQSDNVYVLEAECIHDVSDTDTERKQNVYMTDTSSISENIMSGTKNPTIPQFESMYTGCIHDVRKMDTQVRLGKDRLGEVSVGEDREIGNQSAAPKSESNIKFGYVDLTPEQYSILTQKYPTHIVDEYIKRVDDYCKSRGKGYPNYPQTISKWIDEDVKSGKTVLAKPSYDIDEWARMAENFDPSML